MPGKIRHVDLYPDEWLAGTTELTFAERGIYITICALIYSRGGPVTDDLLKHYCREHGKTINTLLNRLENLGKVSRKGNETSVKRCLLELGKAEKRSEEASQKANQRWHPNGLDEIAALPPASAAANANDQPTNHQLLKSREGLVVNHNLPREGARDRKSPYPTSRPSLSNFKKNHDQEAEPRDGLAEIPEGWLAEAEAARDEAGLDPVNLTLEWLKFAARADGEVELRRWIEWSLRAWKTREPQQHAHAHHHDDPPARTGLGAEPSTWRARVRSFAKSGFWLPDWGFKPDDPSCYAPGDILAEFGYR